MAECTKTLSIIKCAKCRNVLKFPKKLHCGHVFCQSCLNVVKERSSSLSRQLSVVCTECSTVTRVPRNDVGNLPREPWIELLLRCVDQYQENEQCHECGKQASAKWCEECGPLCNVCAEHHTIKRKTKDHHFIDKPRRILCQTHNEPVDKLCQDCPKLLCSQCLQSECANHRLEEISDLALQMKSKAEVIKTKLTDESEKFQTMLSHCKAKVEILAKQKKDMEMDIDMNIQKLLESKKCIADVLRQKEEDLDEVITGVTEKVYFYTELLEDLQTFPHDKNQAEFVLSCKLLERKAQTLDQPVEDELETFNLRLTQSKTEVPTLVSGKDGPLRISKDPNPTEEDYHKQKLPDPEYVCMESLVLDNDFISPAESHSKILTWKVLYVKDGFDILVLPDGRTIITCLNGSLLVFDADGNKIHSNFMHGARGMTHRPKERDILVSSSIQNALYAMDDTTLQIKGSQFVSMKAKEKPYGAALLANDNVAVVYKRGDKDIYVNIYSSQGKLLKQAELGKQLGGSMYIYVTAVQIKNQDIVLISKKQEGEISRWSTCGLQTSTLTTVSVPSPNGMSAISANNVLVASGSSVLQLEITEQPDVMAMPVAELSSEITSVAHFNGQLVCLTQKSANVVKTKRGRSDRITGYENVVIP